MDRPETCLHNGSNNKCSNSNKVVPLHHTALPPSHLAREVGSTSTLTQALYLATSLLDRSSVHQQVGPLFLSLHRRLPT